MISKKKKNSQACQSTSLYAGLLQNISIRENLNESSLEKEDSRCIYCLKDPTTDTPFYVGQTKAAHSRFYAHVRESKDLKTDKDEKINWLMSNGIKPIMEILEICSKENVLEREKFWIEHFGECNLTNSKYRPSKAKFLFAKVTKKALQYIYMIMSFTGENELNAIERIAKDEAIKLAGQECIDKLP